MSTIKVNALRHTGGSSDNINLDSSARVLIGTSSARSNINSGAKTLQIETAVNSVSTGLSVLNNSSTGYTSRIALGLTGGTATGSNTIVSSGNALGALSWVGADGTNLIEAGRIQCNVDGTPGSNDMPGRLSFYTTADGASSPTEAMRIDSSQNLRFNSGYGSVATAYGCRAWVNFQGSGTLTIRDNGNVSSVTDNGGADYTLNFTSNMPDVNYCPVFGGGQFDAGTANFSVGIKTDTNTEGPATLMSTSQLRILAQNGSGGNEDLSYVCVAIFR